jgi:hypothetical protein
LPRAKKLARGKEIFAKCFFSFPRAFHLAPGKEASVSSVFSLPGVLYLALGKAFFAESFLFSSRQKNEL